jgi:hypothetical protein
MSVSRGRRRGVGAQPVIPGSEVQDVEEGGNGIAGRLADLRLVNQSFVEECRGILLLLAGITGSVVALDLLS